MPLTTSFNPFGARKLPETSYIVCATPRSGSALLCEALGRTGLAGIPREYLREWSTDDPATLTKAGRFPPDAYMRKLFEECSTPNGVFGVKIMRGYLEVVTDNLRPFAEHPDASGTDVLASVFPNLHYVYLSRQDKVRQAVSLVKALQSEHWHDVVLGDSQQQPEHERGTKNMPSHGEQERRKQPVYDFGLIAQQYRLLVEQEEAWDTYFTSAGLQPYRVCYEEFEKSYENAGLPILDYLQIPHSDTVVPWQPVLRRQSDAVNDQWTERFTEELRRQSTPGVLKRIASYFTRQ